MHINTWFFKLVKVLYVNRSVIIVPLYYTLNLIAHIIIKVNLIEILTITLWKNNLSK